MVLRGIDWKLNASEQDTNAMVRTNYNRNGLKRATLPSYPNFTRRFGMSMIASIQSAQNTLLQTMIKVLLLLNGRHFMHAKD